MAQLYIQKSAQPDTWVMSGAPTATTVFLSLAATINYSDGSSDTLPANTLAVLPDTTTVFDRTHDVFVCYTVQTSGVLSVIKESLLPTLTSAYAPLCRIELHSIKPYQPEPYLAAGGVGAVGAVTTTPLVSRAGQGRFYTLGTEPAGWQSAGFDDSAWAASALQTWTEGWTPYSGSQNITQNPGGTRPASEVLLFRQSFTLPAGTISAATLHLNQDDVLLGCWVNGTLISGSGSGAFDLDVRAPLRTGSSNLLAIKIQNTAAVGADGLNFGLETTTGGGGTIPDPGASEGDLLYYHGGGWIGLGIGAAGQALSVVSGDPAWATPAGGTVTSVALSGPSGTTVSGSPVTGAGTLSMSWASQTANTLLAAPNGSSGAPTFRALVGADIPVDASTIVSSAGTIKGNYQAGSGISISGNTISATGGGGSVTSVALSMPSGVFSVSGSPITTSGTLAVSLATQSANTVLAGPSSGSAAAPTFRALAPADLPAAASAGGHLHAHAHFL